MIIREVTVVAHEKRNHPYEYGHRDAEVRLTATIEDGDNLEDVLVSLRTRARLHVNQELLWWIRGIETEIAKENHRRTFRKLIDHVHWCVNPDKLSDMVTKAREEFAKFDGLFDAEIEDFYAQLEEAEQIAMARIASNGAEEEPVF